MLCTPILLSLRVDLKSLIDKAWNELSMNDLKSAQLAAKAYLAPENVLIPYSILVKMLSLPPLNLLFEIAKPFGKRGMILVIFGNVLSISD